MHCSIQSESGSGIWSCKGFWMFKKRGGNESEWIHEFWIGHIYFADSGVDIVE